jgi:hypothetical protein
MTCTSVLAGDGMWPPMDARLRHRCQARRIRVQLGGVNRPVLLAVARTCPVVTDGVYLLTVRWSRFVVHDGIRRGLSTDPHRRVLSGVTRAVGTTH